QLLAITERLLAQRERGAVFEAIADTLADVVPHDTLTIYLVDNNEGCLVPILARDQYAEQILASRPALGSGITGDVIAKGEAEWLDQALARGARPGSHLAVLFLDLDSFKMVNDGLGHAAGDAVLRGVALRLRECTRQADTIARLGGDEFGILLEDIHDEADAA